MTDWLSETGWRSYSIHASEDCKPDSAVQVGTGTSVTILNHAAYKNFMDDQRPAPETVDQYTYIVAVQKLADIDEMVKLPFEASRQQF